MTLKRGYSLVVLVIAIAVILILSSVSITMLTTSRETISSSDFIYDITTIEEMLKQYYAEAGTLPVRSNVPITLPAEMNSQLDMLDNENYYELDLSKIGNVDIIDRNRGYIINEQTLRVYCVNPLVYEGQNYYTVTPALMGEENFYQEQAEEIHVAGNPLVWSANARMRVIIPRKALAAKDEGEPTEEFWSQWTFLWDYGPKSIEQIKLSSSAKTFLYGDTLVAKTNGVYSIYVKDPNNNETVLNVVVTKVDDIKPKYSIIDDELSIVDDETGLKGIYYKTIGEYNENVNYAINIGETEDRDELDFYLMGEKGSNLITDMPLDVQEYNDRLRSVKQSRESETIRFNNLSAEQQALEDNIVEHERIMNEIQAEEDSLKREYPYLVDTNAVNETVIDGTVVRPGKLVLYIEDYAGNAIVIGENDSEVISFEMVSKKYNLGEVTQF